MRWRRYAACLLLVVSGGSLASMVHGQYSGPAPYRGGPYVYDEDFLDDPPPAGPSWPRRGYQGPYPLEEQRPRLPGPRQSRFGFGPFEEPYNMRPPGAVPGRERAAPEDYTGSIRPRNDQIYGPPGHVSPPGSNSHPGAPLNLDPEQRSRMAALPPDYQAEENPAELPAHLRRQLVRYPGKEPAGTIVIDTPNTFLYFVLGNGQAIRYGIGVGREGFTWSGVEKISRMAEWPDWHPPADMLERQPYLPRFMAGGPGNPLGARALYLGKTLYRIHGTNQPSTIGQFVSSGCIRLFNEDIEDLYSRVTVGTRVVVLPDHGQRMSSTRAR